VLRRVLSLTPNRARNKIKGLEPLPPPNEPLTKPNRPASESPLAEVEFNRPHFVGSEFENVREALSRKHISSNGLFTKRCQSLLETCLDVEAVLLTASCTDALEMAAILLDVEPGDEVIVPAYGFVSTVNAFVLRGAKPVFCDVRPDTLNLDESCLEALLTPRTKAVVPIHYAGVAAELDAILELCRPRGIAVVEDNAQGLFGRYRGRALGSIGTLGVISFHETKNLICGEGGALLINDPKYIQRAEILRDKGTDRARLFRGEIDRYTWVDVGSSFGLSDVLAAILYAQLNAREAICASRAEIWRRYDEALRPWAAAHGIQLAIIPEHCDPSHHIFYLVLPEAKQQARFIAHLKERGIRAVFHFQPLHLSKMGQRYGGKLGSCPVTESVSPRLVRLPFHNFMATEAQQRVIDATLEFSP
jgi:dTDP-4-amino-4,6-dideoxygalactose transaminase